MNNEQATARQALVPPRQCAVFQQEILIAMSVVVHHIEFAAILQAFHVFYFRLAFVQFYRQLPACHPALIAGITCRAETIAVIRTTTHQVPVIHSLTTGIVDIIKVGIAQAVTEFMTHCANTLNLSISHQLTATGIGVDLQTIADGHHSLSTI